jgi:ribosomal-protein-alanine N-acetyltransferase
VEKEPKELDLTDGSVNCRLCGVEKEKKRPIVVKAYHEHAARILANRRDASMCSTPTHIASVAMATWSQLSQESRTKKSISQVKREHEHTGDIETPRLRLRPPADHDLEFLFRHFSDHVLQDHLCRAQAADPRSRTQFLIDLYLLSSRTPFYRWVLVLKDSGEPIGTCGYHNVRRGGRIAEIGFGLETTAWGRGLMREAIEAVVERGFEQLRFRHIEARVHSDNRRSVRLLLNVGFQQNSTFRQLLRFGKSFRTDLLLTLSARQWNERQKGCQ